MGWILGIGGALGICGGIAALILAPGLAPIVAKIALDALAAVVRAITSAALWCVRQVMVAPAWTAVLIGVIVLAAYGFGQRGYDSGHGIGFSEGRAAGAADLNQCHGNVSNLKTAIDERNTEIIALGKQGDVLRAELKTLGAKSQTETDALRAHLVALAASRPAGKNECERAASARAQILEDRSR